MDAIEALLNEVSRIKPDRPLRLRGQAPMLRQSRAPAQSTFFGSSASWTLAPEAMAEIPGATGVLQCVPYARFISGIGLRGDAWTWWDKAAGTFARGNHPEPGAVLSFPGIERMPLGHVAVVHQILGARKILIDHANWPTATVQHGAISRDILVADVSPANDWTEVRVQFGEGGPLGSVYPANGFIYGWSESGAQIARPRYALDDLSGVRLGPSWRMFNSISYLWALPPTARAKAYAAAGVVPNRAVTSRIKPTLVLGPIGPGLLGDGLVRTMGYNRLELGSDGRPRPGLNRFVMQ